MKSDEQAMAARLQAIQARLTAATQGPWYVDHPRVSFRIRVAHSNAFVMEQGQYGVRVEEDATLIANAPDDLRFLLAHVASLQREQERLQAELDKVAPWTCPICGPHVKVDEDGCCVHCGADAALQSVPPQEKQHRADCSRIGKPCKCELENWVPPQQEQG
jgi:hypothetical protein